MLVSAKAREANNKNPNAPEPPKIYIVEAAAIAIWTAVLIRAATCLTAIVFSKFLCNNLKVEQEFLPAEFD
jgi:hypothetical protein